MGISLCPSVRPSCKKRKNEKKPKQKKEEGESIIVVIQAVDEMVRFC